MAARCMHSLNTSCRWECGNNSLHTTLQLIAQPVVSPTSQMSPGVPLPRLLSNLVMTLYSRSVSFLTLKFFLPCSASRSGLQNSSVWPTWPLPIPSLMWPGHRADCLCITNLWPPHCSFFLSSPHHWLPVRSCVFIFNQSPNFSFVSVFVLFLPIRNALLKDRLCVWILNFGA